MNARLAEDRSASEKKIENTREKFYDEKTSMAQLAQAGREYKQEQSAFDQRQKNIEELQEALDKNRWGNTNMNGVWDAQPGLIGNEPYLRRWDSDKEKWRYSKATKDEAANFFSQDGNGSPKPKSGSRIAQEGYDAFYEGLPIVNYEESERKFANLTLHTQSKEAFPLTTLALGFVVKKSAYCGDGCCGVYNWSYGLF